MVSYSITITRIEDAVTPDPRMPNNDRFEEQILRAFLSEEEVLAVRDAIIGVKFTRSVGLQVDEDGV